MPTCRPEKMVTNMPIGNAATVIDRLKVYEQQGYDEYSFWIDTGMSFARKKARRSNASSLMSCRLSGEAVMQSFEQYIDGAFEARAPPASTSIDPATGQVWASMPEAREVDVDRAVTAAETGACGSATRPAMTATARGKLLYKLADLVQANALKLAELETRDTGKIIRETSAQIAYGADYHRYCAGLRRQDRRRRLLIDKADMEVWTSARADQGRSPRSCRGTANSFSPPSRSALALAAGCTVVGQGIRGWSGAGCWNLPGWCMSVGFPKRVCSMSSQASARPAAVR